MRKISCTRMELLARKAQIALASQGRDLLEEKRTALMKEFMGVADIVLQHTDALQDAAANARQALARAEAVASTEVLKSAGLASSEELTLQVTTANVMGIRVPHIEQRRVSRTAFGRGYSIVGTSITIDEAASAFESEVDTIIELAESELRLTRLADEIQRTSRRLNALEHVVIPGLEAELEFIKMSLDERERADHFRLKLTKRLLERKREAQGAQVRCVE